MQAPPLAACCFTTCERIYVRCDLPPANPCLCRPAPSLHRHQRRPLAMLRDSSSPLPAASSGHARGGIGQPSPAAPSDTPMRWGCPGVLPEKLFDHVPRPVRIGHPLDLDRITDAKFLRSIRFALPADMTPGPTDLPSSRRPRPWEKVSSHPATRVATNATVGSISLRRTLHQWASTPTIQRRATGGCALTGRCEADSDGQPQKMTAPYMRTVALPPWGKSWTSTARHSTAPLPR